ncbi:PadR family transcriptional regulator [Pontibacillus yanchengensis]|uniref:PadR family transcriptional regulator n=1 Tax=Pontibacillus yanchengensis Y32 TaxID=1385514 RepID=A0A0A2T8Z1_9BACI|nr:PadR family transcriptional regulator [Pontibacillus yanchengensis]KGP72024.1 PadR family transcriptional regulator [Pontibacillus yanchengensis Y32]
MNPQFKKGILELCVLVIVKQKDQYGYELAQNLTEKIAIAEGSLYPLLRRLTKEDYLQTYMAKSTEGPPRKYYRLTDEGERYMETLIHDWNIFQESVNHLIKEVYES